jgi:signal transduction histidine kinase
LETQESERRRIAGELHDEIGQALTGAKMMLETMEASAYHDSQPPQRMSANTTLEASADGPQLREISAVIAKTLEQVRDLSQDLRPAILDSLGLSPALKWHFARYTRQTGVAVDFGSQGLNRRLPTQIEAGAYRLIQEALTNVARHAGVTSVTVQAYAAEDTLSVFVVDEGVGFEVDDALATGASTGIAGMRERANLLGGTIVISSTPGAGTTIEAQLPLQSASPALTAEQADGHVGSAAQAEDERKRDIARDLARDVSRDALRDVTRDNMRDNTRDQERDRTRDATRDAASEQDRRRRDSPQSSEEGER